MTTFKTIINKSQLEGFLNKFGQPCDDYKYTVNRSYRRNIRMFADNTAEWYDLSIVSTRTDNLELFTEVCKQLTRDERK